MTRARVLDLVGLLARLVLGIVLLVAGGLKVGNPRGSARAVQAYEVMPFDIAGYVGYALPWIEVIVGALLVLGLFTRVTGLIGTLLMVAFVVGIAQAWARGLTIDCGCFGGGGEVAAEETRYGREIARDVLFAVCGTWVVIRPRTTYSLDQLLFGDDKEQV